MIKRQISALLVLAALLCPAYPALADEDAAATACAGADIGCHVFREKLFPIGQTRGSCLAVSLLVAHELNCKFKYKSVDQEIDIKRNFIADAKANSLISCADNSVRKRAGLLKYYDEKVLCNSALKDVDTVAPRNLLGVEKSCNKGRKGEYAVGYYNDITHWVVIKDNEMVWDSCEKLVYNYKGNDPDRIYYIYYADEKTDGETICE